MARSSPARSLRLRTGRALGVVVPARLAPWFLDEVEDREAFPVVAVAKPATPLPLVLAVLPNNGMAGVVTHLDVHCKLAVYAGWFTVLRERGMFAANSHRECWIGVLDAKAGVLPSVCRRCGTRLVHVELATGKRSTPQVHLLQHRARRVGQLIHQSGHILQAVFHSFGNKWRIASQVIDCSC